MSTSAPPTIPPTAAGTSFLSFISGPNGGFKGLLPLLPLLGGAAAILIGSLSSQTNSEHAYSIIVPGVLSAIVGIVGLLYTSGKGKPLFDWFSGLSGKSQSQSAFGLTALVVVIVISIFTTFFYSYSPSEALSLSVIVSLVGVVLATIAMLFKFSEQNVLANVMSRFGFSLYFFMPYALFTFGFVYDIVMKKIQYIPASFAGLTGILVNYLLTVLNSVSTNEPLPIVTNSLCEIPGLSQLSSSFAPQSMMFTLSILAYIATYITRSNIGGVSGFVVDADYRWPSWALFFSVWLFHSFVLIGSGCSTPWKALAWGLALPIGWGGLLGFIGFATMERSDKTNPSPTRYSSGGGEKSPLDVADCPTSLSEDGNLVGTCSAVATDGEFSAK